MSALQIFDYDDQQVRVRLDPNGQPWWVARDVCNVLELTDPSKTMERIKPSEKGTNRIRTPGGPQQMLVVNEPGLYRLIFRSNKPEAEAFQDWVFGEVLPQIRRTGQYVAPAKVDHTNGNIQALAKINQQLAAIVGDHEAQITENTTRLDELERRVEQKALPSAHEVDVEGLRTRFPGAMKSAFYGTDYTRGMTKQERGEFYREVNTVLKRVIMNGRARKNWKRGHYETAVGWLRQRYDIDLSWIFEAAMEAA